MKENIYWFKDAPKDKSELIFYADTGRELKASKEYLVLREDGIYDFGNYVHSRKQWLDRGTFEIEIIKYCEL